MLDNQMIGKYVLVRCRDAGVHAGYLVAYKGRGCVLRDSKRLWYWKVPPNSGDFLSAVALHGLHEDSKLGEKLPRIHLTENCEIILCSNKAEKSITGMNRYEP